MTIIENLSGDGLDEKQQSIVDTLVKTVTERILEGIYEPGRRLVEADLSRDLNAGRGSVREALRRLQAGQLIVFENNRGALVANPGPDEVRAALEVREVIFGLAARGAARSQPVQSKVALRLLVDVEKELRSGKLKDHRARNLAFHDAIYTMSGNPHAAPLMEQYILPTLYHLYFRDMDEATFRENVIEQRQICLAIVRADAEGAENLARMFVRSRVNAALKLAEAPRSAKRRSL